LTKSPWFAIIACVNCAARVVIVVVESVFLAERTNELHSTKKGAVNYPPMRFHELCWVS